MYIPPYYELKDGQLIERIMTAHSFGLLVTPLQATHLAFTLEKKDSANTYLTGHMAKSNPQVKCLGKEALAIFQGPHAYISPDRYTRNASVPTWNYIAVHCYGTTEILSETAHYEVVEKLINHHEPAYLHRWQTLPEAYRNGLSQGIVAFQMKIERVEAAVKLSQDRTPEEQQNIIRHLKASQVSSDRELAAWMEAVLS
jgi:transcriptional regulator